MGADNPCPDFVEELTGAEPLSEALTAHLRACPECRAARETLHAMRAEASAYPSDDIARRKQRVLDRLAPSLKTGKTGKTVTSPEPPPAGLAGLLSGRIWPLALGFSLLMLVAGLSLREAPPEKAVPVSGPAADTWAVTWQDGRQQRFPLGAPIRLDQGTARIAAPDGSTCEITGSVTIRVTSQGFEYDVPPASATVRVLAGHVKISGSNGVSRTVNAGGSEWLGKSPPASSSPVANLNGE